MFSEKRYATRLINVLPYHRAEGVKRQSKDGLHLSDAVPGCNIAGFSDWIVKSIREPF